MEFLKVINDNIITNIMLLFFISAIIVGIIKLIKNAHTG